MIKSLRFPTLLWFIAPLGALGFLLWLNAARLQHIAYVTALGGWSEHPPAARDAAAIPSELSPGNGLIIPEHLTASYHWIAQAQRMFNRGEWRVRHVDYENAPFGRAVLAASPYRWWLGAVAWVDHVISGRAPGLLVERAALVADPLLHLLLLLGTVGLIAWRFGAFPAALASLGMVGLFPFAAEFLPGAPDDHGLALLLGIGSVLLLLAGIGGTASSTDGAKSPRRWFFCAGVAGGLGVWLSPSGQVPVLIGIAAGAWLAAWVARNRATKDSATTTALPWRAWAAGGGGTVLGAYLVEFSPGQLGDWQFSVIHPLYGVAWLGGGELLAQSAAWIQGEKFSRSFRPVAQLALAAAAVAALPVAMWQAHGHEFLIPDAASFRLTRLPDGAVAESLGAWLSREGQVMPILAVLLPVLLLAPALWLLVRRQAGSEPPVAVALALGPVLMALVCACRQLVWWNEFDGLVLVLLVATAASWPVAANRHPIRLAWAGVVLLLLIPGILQLTAHAKAGMKNTLTEPEVYGLIERDVAGWLSLHADAGGVVVLAPPNETTALCYYGRLRGIGTLSWENKDGVAAAMRILSASTGEEAKELIDRRGITHLVLLSWDTTFDQYARAGTGQVEGTFRDQLRFTTLPPWLRPVAYPLPTIAGFEGQSVTIYEVVEDQDAAVALSRIAEYFVEMGDVDQAASVAAALRRFPADLGAWVARAGIEQAQGDEAGFAKSLALLETRLSAKTAPALPWDQRVELAVVLAKGKKLRLAQEQVRLCIAAATEKKLRALSPGSLYRLLVLSRAFNLPLDPKLREAALDLLPGEQRERL